MPQESEDVKHWAKCKAWCVKRKAAALRFFDFHPRLGWYIAGVGTLNLLVNLLDLFM